MGVIPFEFAGTPVRVLQPEHAAGGPLFNAGDVATALGYARPRDAIAQHCEGAVKRRVPTAGGEQEVTFIPEPDLYRLIFRSNLPAAKAFEAWVVGTVLPSVRKHGGYVAGQEVEQDPALIMARALQVAQNVIAQKTAEADLAKLELAQAMPAVEFFDAVGSTKDLIAIGDLAQVLGTGQNRLFATLRRLGVLQASNQPYQAYIDRGYFVVRERTWRHPTTGDERINLRTFVTGRGQEWVRKKWLEAEQNKSKQPAQV
jgi:anti-repressor protein